MWPVTVSRLTVSIPRLDSTSLTSPLLKLFRRLLLLSLKGEERLASGDHSPEALILSYQPA